MVADAPKDLPSVSPEPNADTGKRSWGLRPLVFASFALAGLSAVFSALALLFAAGVLPPLRGTDDLEHQLRAYLLDNPEVIVESVQGMEARRQAAANSEATAVIAQRRDEIFNDPDAPVGTNPRGDAVLVEFFDYNCPYCRQATPMLDRFEREDKGLRLVFKEYPILGPGSVFAARAALASQKQGKYLTFHKAMMAYEGRITEASSLEVAANVGLDVEKLKQDMKDPAIDAAIKRNIALAQALQISGTPSFVAGRKIVRGLTDADGFKRLIARLGGASHHVCEDGSLLSAGNCRGGLGNRRRVAMAGRSDHGRRSLVRDHRARQDALHQTLRRLSRSEPRGAARLEEPAAIRAHARAAARCIRPHLASCGPRALPHYQGRTGGGCRRGLPKRYARLREYHERRRNPRRDRLHQKHMAGAGAAISGGDDPAGAGDAVTEGVRHSDHVTSAVRCPRT
ncbi:hypothetical protein NGR_b08590 (plasmid) [Sinorhizobium fredii NGR234]|uniref:Thioredoxin domain-containing protein n=1 Tax=Sinorhizobium fredii (strain NBRC 101917 / NGR234) TaxID=394 RepID=C3KQF7_SINFN|nr:hypothetical protein NGR_b08590 [Sinorhizobium fredii NGR234]